MVFPLLNNTSGSKMLQHFDGLQKTYEEMACYFGDYNSAQLTKLVLGSCNDFGACAAAGHKLDINL